MTKLNKEALNLGKIEIDENGLTVAEAREIYEVGPRSDDEAAERAENTNIR